MKMCTVDSLDDSLIERKQKEIHKLEERVEALDAQISLLNSKCNEEYKKRRELQQENQTLKNKLLVYEHEPLKLRKSLESIDILYWDSDAKGYEMFATFFDNNLENNLDDLCEELLLILKEMYMVE